MSQPMLDARINRIIALRTVAARNAHGASDKIGSETGETTTGRPHLTVVDNPWQAENLAA